MPAAVIEVRRQYSPDESSAIIEAVHAALVEAFRIPEHDRNIRLVTHDPSQFTCSPSLEHPEFRTIVTIDCFVGRSLDAKRHLYRSVIDRLTALGIPGDHVSTILHEIPLENWGLGGGVAAADADLGFALDV